MVSDLQSNIQIVENKITGTLKYVTGYTGFNASNPSEQEGNFLALKVSSDESEDVSYVVHLVGGTKGPVTLDEDKNIVLKISNKDTQTIKVSATATDGTESQEFGLSGLVLEEKTE